MKLRICTMASLLGLASVSILTAAAPNLPKSGLAGTMHDFGGVGCKGCHAPHNGAASMGQTGPANTGLILLWAKSFPAATTTYGTYSSPTMTSTVTELGGSLLSSASDARMYSLLCLSCHDGVTSSYTVAPATTTYPPPAPTVGSMYQADMVGSTQTATNSLGLTNDHPVNLPYNPTLNPTGLQPIATVSAALPLYGTTNTVQCSTCHDPHNNTNTMYLRQANNAAGCLTCHM